MDVPGEAAAARSLEVLSQTVAAEHDCERALLDGYLHALLAVAATNRRLSELETATCRRLGGAAAQSGVALPTLVDLYMAASRRLWPRLPELVAASRGRSVHPTELVGLGQAVWHAASDAIAALTVGDVEAQRLVVLREEALRLQFVDDLLAGSPDVGSLVERAETYGLTLAAAHIVAVARTGQPVDAAGRVTDWVEQAVRARFGGRGVLVTVRDGHLLCALSTGAGVAGPVAETAAAPLADLIGTAAAELSGGATWRVGVSRPHPGPRGIFRCYTEALEAVDVADRLDLPDPVVHAGHLLVYRVLLRDETAMSELVDAVLGPLLTARDGPDRLLRTLEAYFGAGCSTAAAARRLHLSVRATTYRLQRIAELTGHAPTDPADQLALHVAVTGARLLDWPHRPLVTE